MVRQKINVKFSEIQIPLWSSVVKGDPEQKRQTNTLACNEGKSPINTQVASQNKAPVSKNINKTSSTDISVINSLEDISLRNIMDTNNIYKDPVLLIYGSFSRKAQGQVCEYNDIDLLCHSDEIANIFICKVKKEMMFLMTHQETDKSKDKEENRKESIKLPRLNFYDYRPTGALDNGCPQLDLPTLWGFSIRNMDSCEPQGDRTGRTIIL